MKSDICSIDDIKAIVDTFYNKAIVDKQIGFFFTEVMTLTLKEHLPIIYSFWDSVIFGSASYKGNIMLKHIALHKKSKLEVGHFQRWIALWKETITESYSGKNADLMIHRAELMKDLMIFKTAQSQQSGFIQ